MNPEILAYLPQIAPVATLVIVVLGVFFAEAALRLGLEPPEVAAAFSEVSPAPGRLGLEDQFAATSQLPPTGAFQLIAVISSPPVFPNEFRWDSDAWDGRSKNVGKARLADRDHSQRQNSPAL